MFQSFSGKVILFGEYSVIAGSRALVIPLPRFSGKLVLPGKQNLTEKQNFPDKRILSESEEKHSNDELRDFFRFLAGRQDESDPGSMLDLIRLERDLENGLYFRSSIPVQYGAGSSAALVSSVYDAYSIHKIDRGSEKEEDLITLRTCLGMFESHFHGKSSGIDPLCSYTGRNMIIQKDKIVPVLIPGRKEENKLFLMDSGRKGATASLVNDFTSRMEKEIDFAGSVRNDLTNLVDRGIRSLTDQKGDLINIFRELSRWQMEFFSNLIPDPVRQVWNNGLKSGAYSLKLCGSGGGGFFLGCTADLPKVLAMSDKSGMEILPLDL